MAFGQQSGPPATARQLEQLLTLLHHAGHLDFRDARGPMGFTQRQAGGMFTRQEADVLIERLQSAADEAAEAASPTTSHLPHRQTREPTDVATRPSVATVSGADQRALRRLPTEALLEELRRRGWDGARPGE